MFHEYRRRRVDHAFSYKAAVHWEACENMRYRIDELLAAWTRVFPDNPLPTPRQPEPDCTTSLSRSLYQAFRNNVAVKINPGKDDDPRWVYRNVREASKGDIGLDLSLSHNCCLRKGIWPKYLIYSSVGL